MKVKLLDYRIPDYNRGGENHAAMKFFAAPNTMQPYLHPLQRELVVPPEGSPQPVFYHFLIRAAVTAESPTNIHLPKPAGVSTV